MKDDLLLGRLLGRQEAFDGVAALSSAAAVDAMLKIRDEKLYLDHAKDWGEFCQKYFHTKKDNANRLIRLLQQFGPAYFRVAQFTRISPQTYRALEPSVREDGLHHKGDVIALIPENADKVAAAVAEYKKSTPKRPPRKEETELRQQCVDVVVKLKLACDDPSQRSEVRISVAYLRAQLNEIGFSLR